MLLGDKEAKVFPVVMMSVSRQSIIGRNGWLRGDTGIMIIALTNEPDIKALLRPGRFDRQVTIDLHDIKDWGRNSSSTYERIFQSSRLIDVERLAKSNSDSPVRT